MPFLIEAGERNVSKRIVLLTGASRGIGLYTARELVSRGAHVICVARGADTLNAAVLSLNDEAAEKSGGKATAVVCDIGNLLDIKNLFGKHLPALGVEHIDILIANAGIMPCIFMDPATTDDALELATMRVNAEGSHFLTKYALPFMLRRREDIAEDPFQRSVLYMSSAAAWLAEPEEGNGMLAYHASKASVNGTMVSLYQTFDAPCEEGSMTAMVRAGRTIGGRIASINPGFVATGLGGETLPPGIDDCEAYETAKLESMGAIPIEAGADTLLWLALAKDGVAESGKHYFERKVHTF